MKVQPKKKLGQHFLKDKQIARRIAELVSGLNSDYILEIGPGMGILTEPLLERFGDKLHVIEIDSESVAYMHEHFPALEGRIHEADFLKMDLATVFPGTISVVGNYPYNISSQILFHLLDDPKPVNEVCGMFQREVGRRLTSGPGSKEYGILSVLLDFYFERNYEFTVSETVFNPPPQVKSGVIRLTRKESVPQDVDFKVYKKLVKAAFNQRRKMLRNSLSVFYTPEILATDVFRLRPEQLAPESFLGLMELFE